jgi:hypothetical protein
MTGPEDTGRLLRVDATVDDQAEIGQEPTSDRRDSAPRSGLSNSVVGAFQDEPEWCASGNFTVLALTRRAWDAE